MNPRKRKKLEIKKQTVRLLDRGDLERVAGMWGTYRDRCSTTTIKNDPLGEEGSHCVCEPVYTYDGCIVTSI